jgi:hypothetical protein
MYRAIQIELDQQTPSLKQYHGAVTVLKVGVAVGVSLAIR